VPKVPMVHRLFFGGALVHQSDAERPGGHDAMAALMSLSLQPRCIKSFTASLATCCSANVKGTTDPPLPAVLRRRLPVVRRLSGPGR
jgi:hypothetical protein